MRFCDGSARRLCWMAQFYLSWQVIKSFMFVYVISDFMGETFNNPLFILCLSFLTILWILYGIFFYFNVCILEEK